MARSQNGARELSATSRRRRRLRHQSQFQVEDTSIRPPDAPLKPEESREKLAKESKELIGGSIEPFVPTNADGDEITILEYLEMASLSPWVPVPDIVARRALDVAKASSDDVHYDLGSGDGRVNFHAIDAPYSVKKSVGIDIDLALVLRANNRLALRHPKPKNAQFVCADLLDNEQSGAIWDNLGNECTVLTMYFVEEALQKIKPKLEEKLSGSDCRIVTIGYKMHGWQPQWDETNLGLPIYMYSLQNEEEEHPLTPDDMESMIVANEQAMEEMRKLLRSQEPSVPLSMMSQDEFPEPEMPPTLFGSGGEEDGDWDFDETIKYDLEGNILDEDGNTIKEDEDSDMDVANEATKRT